MKTLESKLEKLLVTESVTVKEALRQLEAGSKKILFVVDANRLLKGTLTDGDIRRWILEKGDLNQDISRVYNSKPKSITNRSTGDQIRKIMTQEKIEALPVLDTQGQLIDMVFSNDLFSRDCRPKEPTLKVPVLVIAGGKGTRLEPFTNIFPKPLIPFGDKTIIDVILDRFSQHGCDEFFLSINYKSEMIRSYFEHSGAKYHVTFIEENQPTGTAGSLRDAGKLIDAPDLFVSNCDIIIKADYSDICDFHLRHKNDITIVGSIQHITVPYGVLQTKSGGLLDEIVEKPEYDFMVNTGFYMVKKEVIRLIPEGQRVDFPEFISRVKEAGGQIRVYPISQTEWIDIGQWPAYKSALDYFKS